MWAGGMSWQLQAAPSQHVHAQGTLPASALPADMGSSDTLILLSLWVAYFCVSASSPGLSCISGVGPASAKSRRPAPAPAGRALACSPPADWGLACSRPPAMRASMDPHPRTRPGHGGEHGGSCVTGGAKQGPGGRAWAPSPAGGCVAGASSTRGRATAGRATVDTRAGLSLPSLLGM